MDNVAVPTKGLPIPLGKKSNRPEAPTNSVLKGLGGIRFKRNLLKNSEKNMLAVQQMAEVADGGRSR
jgi:hypothetical protein